MGITNMLEYWIFTDNFITIWVIARDNLILDMGTGNDRTNSILPKTDNLNECVGILVEKGYKASYSDKMI
jgi:hypothetical protein